MQHVVVGRIDQLVQVALMDIILDVLLKERIAIVIVQKARKNCQKNYLKEIILSTGISKEISQVLLVIQ